MKNYDRDFNRTRNGIGFLIFLMALLKIGVVIFLCWVLVRVLQHYGIL